ncbi:unnamed protein product [Lactuca virosa]|uniref:Uncharacterized protein n=1 Tax=Lactuca virosa TaxID=75947 RepID=A0AAU9NFM0_9ASTR|nr:unnamed protein product [Lactuca virosa]
MGEEVESHRVEVAMQLQEILESIKDLKVERDKKKKKKKESDSERESSDSDDDKSKDSSDHVGSGFHKGKNKDSLCDSRKIKMPIFSRADAYGWIYRVKRYFEVQGISKKDQLRATCLCMEGSALAMGGGTIAMPYIGKYQEEAIGSLSTIIRSWTNT